jgi:hypothetical protein
MLRTVNAAAQEGFPKRTRETLNALESGLDPGCDAIVLV